ncbi:MAG TPA: hypothetical protein VME43_10595 [Bryobacteraceae bacterium]|nr:hypothetical protein [Bryobacteraceae bacterium]
MKLDYRNTQAALEEELRRLDRVSERLTRMQQRVARQRESVSAAIQALTNAISSRESEALPPPLEEAGFEITASIREVLRKSEEALSAPEIRDALAERGWKPEDYDNPLAVVHTILKRLLNSGDAEYDQGSEGTRYYFDPRQRAEREAAKEADWNARHEEEAAVKRQQETEIRTARNAARRELALAACALVRLSKRALTAKEIALQLEEKGVVDFSSWSAPSRAVATALKGMPEIEMFRGTISGMENNFYRSVNAEKWQAVKAAKQ